MLNKKNSSSNNVKSAVFAAALAASAGVYADQANTILNQSTDAEIIRAMNDIAGKDWAARKLSNGTQIIKEGDTFKVVYNDGVTDVYTNKNGSYVRKNEGNLHLAGTEGKLVSFTPTQNGVTASYNDNGTIFSGKAGNSTQYGPSLDVGVASKLGDNSAFALNIEGGPKMQRVLGSLGFSFNGGNLIFSGEHFGAKQKFSFTSGEVEEMVRQNKAGVALKIKVSDGFVESFVADGSMTKSEAKELKNKEVIIDNATVFAIYDNYRRIAAGEQKQGSLGFVFKLGDNTRLELKARYDELSFDTKYSNSDVKKSFGGDAKLTHSFGNGVTGNVSVGTGLMGKNYGAGVEMPLGDGHLGVVVKHTDAANGLPSDTYAGLTYRMSFGGPNTSKKSPQSSVANYNNLVADVMARNSSFASQTILAKADEKMVRRLEIDKTGLPAGVSVINNQGDIEVAGVNVLSIAGITKDATLFTNAGQFTIVGGKLRIITSALSEPTSGTNTYVVTTNNVGGGTANVTIIVAKGSVIIQSVNIVTNAAEVAPVMGDVPNQTATAGSAFSLNVSPLVTLTNGDAVVSYALTGTLPTGVTFNSSTGVLSGTPTQTGIFNLSVTATDNDGASNSDSFTLTVNAAPDSTPNAFDILNMTNQTINTVVTTGSITVAGTNTAATASTSIGTIVKNGTDTGLASTTVNSGDTVAVKFTTSASYSTTTNGVLDIGGVTDGFSATTEVAPNLPPTGQNITVDANFSGSYSVDLTPYLNDPEGDTIIATFVGAGSLFGDADMNGAKVENNIASVGPILGSGVGFIDYQVGGTTYRITIDNLSQ